MFQSVTLYRGSVRLQVLAKKIPCLFSLLWTLHPKHCRCMFCTFSTVQDYCFAWWHPLTHHCR